MCRALGLSRSGHHSFSTRKPSRRELGQQELEVSVAAIFAELKAKYRAPRIEQELRRRGKNTRKKRVAAESGQNLKSRSARVPAGACALPSASEARLRRYSHCGV